MLAASNIMRLSLIFVVILGISELAHGAQRVDIKERVKENLNQNFLRLGKRHARSVETTADHLLSLNRDETLTPTDSVRTADNTMKIKYTEQYKGLPVIGEAVVLELTPDGQFTDDASGTILEHIEDDVPSIEPALNKEEAFAIAVTRSGRTMEDISYKPERDIRLVIYTAHDVSDSEETRNLEAYLAYEVTITIMDPTWPEEYQYTIDANTGEILEKSNLLESFGIHKNKHRQRVMEIEAMGGNEKIGAYKYGVDRENLQVYTEDGITCRLENDNVAVVHMNFTTDTDKYDENSTGFEFDCKEGYNDAKNGAYSPLSDSYYFFNKVYNMFQEWYGSKALKRRAVIGVHYAEDMENAFYMSTQNFMGIGDGAKRFHPLSSIGVIAHEIAHGFTNDHSNLKYRDQSGGINEAFSDMASEAAQLYLSCQSDWMIGYEIAKNETGTLRFLYDPPRDNRSVASLQDYCPGVDVHHSSGIFNKAFYLLSHRPGWEIRKAFHIFVNANKLYWSKYTDFAEGACGAVKAAKDLGYSTEDVKAVFRDVDVEPCVKRHFNFQNLVRRPLKMDQRIHKYFDLKSDTKEMTIEVHEIDSNRGPPASRPQSNTTYDLTITYNGRSIHEVSSNVTEIVTLKDLKPGRYYITIEGYVPMMSVLVLFDHFFHADLTTQNTTGERFSDSVSFNVTTAHSKDGIVIRSKADGDSDGDHSMYTRYGLKVDLSNHKYDNRGHGLEGGILEVLYCASNTGMYDVMVTNRNSTNITVDAYRVFNMFPQMEMV